MLPLPMPALVITGLDGNIRLTLEKVWGYPHELSYGGGYGAKGNLTIQADGYTVVAEHHYTTGELACFYQQLRGCYNTLTGTAVLANTEHELELQCAFNKLGHVIITGCFRADVTKDNSLQFIIHTDQT